ncbi:MAG: hypothetical protein ACREV9_01630 [Burkholderiales bacterium]
MNANIPASNRSSNTRQGKSSSRNFKTAALALALLGVAYLTSTGQSPMVPAATAENVATAISSNDWQYFPDLFVNQGTEFEESYIEQF